MKGWESCLFSLAKGRLKEDLVRVLQNLKRSYRDDRSRFLTWVHGDRRKGKGHKLPRQHFIQKEEKNFIMATTKCFWQLWDNYWSLLVNCERKMPLPRNWRREEGRLADSRTGAQQKLSWMSQQPCPRREEKCSGKGNWEVEPTGNDGLNKLLLNCRPAIYLQTSRGRYLPTGGSQQEVAHAAIRNWHV